MFHANEACDGKGTLTVENGEMTIHVSLASTSILNLFPGTAEDARRRKVRSCFSPPPTPLPIPTASRRRSIGFDIPVPALDEEFDLALIGKKGTWYDHKVSVSNPVPVEESGKTVDDLALARRHLHRRADLRRRLRQGLYPVSLHADRRGRQGRGYRRLEQQQV